MTGALRDLQLQLSPPPPPSLASIRPANTGSPGKMAIKMEKEREIDNSLSLGLGYRQTSKWIDATVENPMMTIISFRSNIGLGAK